MEGIPSMSFARVADMEPQDVPVQQEGQDDILQSSLKTDMIIFNGLLFFVVEFKLFISIA